MLCLWNAFITDCGPWAFKKQLFQIISKVQMVFCSEKTSWPPFYLWPHSGSFRFLWVFSFIIIYSAACHSPTVGMSLFPWDAGVTALTITLMSFFADPVSCQPPPGRLSDEYQGPAPTIWTTWQPWQKPLLQPTAKGAFLTLSILDRYYTPSKFPLSKLELSKQ